MFGFCTPDQRESFFPQLPSFEQTLVDDGMYLFKIWLNVGRAEQLRRFLERESDPLKQWKLSPIDVEGLALWDGYTSAIGETLSRSHTPDTPWTVIRSDDKRRARIAAIQTVLQAVPYEGRDTDAIGLRDDAICGGRISCRARGRSVGRQETRISPWQPAPSPRGSCDRPD